MPNYSLVSNAVFQPFSYQELLAPVMHQQQVQDQLAEQYEKLSSQADILEAMGANDRDSKAYRNFKNYSDNLRTEADNLYRNGLNSESRLRLSELKRRYNSEIVPIQNAWNKREEEAQMQMKASIANPMIRFTRDASRTSLDQYLANPSGGYGVINLANIASQMGAAAKNLTNQLRGGVEVEGIDDFTKRHITKYGIDATVVNQWIKDPSKNPALTNMMNQVLATNGVTEDVIRNNPNLFTEATQAAQSGAWNAIGKEESQIVPDYYRRAMLDFDLKERAANNEYARKLQYETAKAQAAGVSDSPNITSDGISIDTTEHYTANGLAELGALKAGNDALKSSYFGNRAGKVNPMQIYEEYQKEIQRLQSIGSWHNTQHSKPTSDWHAQSYSKPTSRWNSRNGKYNTADANRSTAQEVAKNNILKKYKGYGVTNILSDTQYQLLSDMGYSKDNNPAMSSNGRSPRFSTIEQGFNSLVKQKNRYSVNMTKYDSVNESIQGNLTELEANDKLSGRLWQIEKDGKLSNPKSDIGDLNFKTADNSKGNTVNGIYYDPQYYRNGQPGTIVFRMSDGKRYLATADVINGNLYSMITRMENEGRSPQYITAAIYGALNAKNKVQGETDSKV